MMRYWMMICEMSGTPVEAFLNELWSVSSENPFNRRQRVINNEALVEVQPDIDDRAHAIHISDILALEAGQRRGQGRNALRLLLQLADKYHVTLTLFAEAYAKGPGSDKYPKTKDLTAWYAHYGFRRSQGQMVRRPGTPIPTPRAG